MREKNLRIWNYIFPLIALAVIVILWAISARIVNEEILLPTISSTFSSLWEILKSKSFYILVLNTLARALASYAIAFVLAIALAILSSYLKKTGEVLSIYVSILRAVPTMSIILLALMWISTLRVPMLVAFIVVFPVMYTNFLNAIKSVDARLVEMANIYKVPKLKQIKNLYLPEMSYSVFSNVRSTISLNLKLIIAAEVMAQTRDSIGVEMQLSMLYLRMDKLFAWTIIAVVLGIILESIVILIQKLVTGDKK